MPWSASTSLVAIRLSIVSSSLCYQFKEADSRFRLKWRIKVELASQDKLKQTIGSMNGNGKLKGDNIICPMWSTWVGTLHRSIEGISDKDASIGLKHPKTAVHFYASSKHRPKHK